MLQLNLTGFLTLRLSFTPRTVDLPHNRDTDILLPAVTPPLFLPYSVWVWCAWNLTDFQLVCNSLPRESSRLIFVFYSEAQLTSNPKWRRTAIPRDPLVISVLQTSIPQTSWARLSSIPSRWKMWLSYLIVVSWMPNTLRPNVHSS